MWICKKYNYTFVYLSFLKVNNADNPSDCVRQCVCLCVIVLLLFACTAAQGENLTTRNTLHRSTSVGLKNRKFHFLKYTYHHM